VTENIDPPSSIDEDDERDKAHYTQIAYSITLHPNGKYIVCNSSLASYLSIGESNEITS